MLKDAFGDKEMRKSKFLSFVLQIFQSKVEDESRSGAPNGVHRKEVSYLASYLVIQQY